MHRLILKYWRDWFPRLPSYQTFVQRLNLMEPTFQTFGVLLSDALAARQTPELDHLVDSLPVMLARHGHSYRARVGREVADIGFCAAKKRRFHGVRLRTLRRPGLPDAGNHQPFERAGGAARRAAEEAERQRANRRGELLQPSSAFHPSAQRKPLQLDTGEDRYSESEQSALD